MSLQKKGTLAKHRNNHLKKRCRSQKLPCRELRKHIVSVRMSLAELATLDAKRKPLFMQRGEWLRVTALAARPKQIPVLNQKAWIKLSRSADHLHQLGNWFLRHATEEKELQTSLSDLKQMLDEFRSRLLGSTLESEENPR